MERRPQRRLLPQRTPSGCTCRRSSIPGFSYETVNVETQLNNPHSLLWWMKRLIALRKRFRAFGRGTLEFLHPSNAKVLAFIRRHENERILVVANLSRHAQFVELDLSEFREMVPVELFGQTDFPRIGELPYLLTLAPHAYYWFALEERGSAALEEEDGGAARPLPAFSVQSSWQNLFRGRGKTELEEILPAFFKTRRWFGGKARRIRGAEILDAIPVPVGRGTSFLTLVQVEYTEGDPDTYVVTLGFTTGERATQILRARAAPGGGPPPGEGRRGRPPRHLRGAGLLERPARDGGPPPGAQGARRQPGGAPGPRVPAAAGHRRRWTPCRWGRSRATARWSSATA